MRSSSCDERSSQSAPSGDGQSDGHKVHFPEATALDECGGDTFDRGPDPWPRQCVRGRRDRARDLDAAPLQELLLKPQEADEVWARSDPIHITEREALGDEATEQAVRGARSEAAPVGHRSDARGDVTALRRQLVVDRNLNEIEPAEQIHHGVPRLMEGGAPSIGIRELVERVSIEEGLEDLNRSVSTVEKGTGTPLL